jgi:hypothetical protein
MKKLIKIPAISRWPNIGLKIFTTQTLTPRRTSIFFILCQEKFAAMASPFVYHQMGKYKISRIISRNISLNNPAVTFCAIPRSRTSTYTQVSVFYGLFIPHNDFNNFLLILFASGELSKFHYGAYLSTIAQKSGFEKIFIKICQPLSPP